MPNFVDKKIVDLRPKDAVKSYYYIKEADVKTTTTNNKYMNFTLSDKTGDINAKLWDWDEENANRFKVGTIVKVQASVVEWQGQLQMKIQRPKCPCLPNRIESGRYMSRKRRISVRRR